jgi:hypothetical protein
MTLRRRLFLFVSTLIAIGLPSAGVVFAYVSWLSVLERTERDGILIAQTLAQSVTFIQQVPTALEQIIDKNVLTQADIVAQLTHLAQQKKTSALEINRALRTIAVRNGIPEVWVTDASGKPLFWSLDDLDASIALDSGLTLQPEFKPLLQGQQYSLSTDLKYRTIDHRRIVLRRSDDAGSERRHDSDRPSAKPCQQHHPERRPEEDGRQRSLGGTDRRHLDIQ